MCSYYARHMIIMVTGEKKRHSLSLIMNNRKKSAKSPAYHLEPVDGKMKWYPDVKAASLI